jgi:CheB methylesterase
MDNVAATAGSCPGQRPAAVILTGMGCDGQAGTRASARCGGTVLAQDQATSRFFSMPAPPSPPITCSRSSAWTPSPTPSSGTSPEQDQRPREQRGRPRAPRGETIQVRACTSGRAGRAGVGDHGDRLGLDEPRVHVERDTRRDRIRRGSEPVDDPSPQQQPGLTSPRRVALPHARRGRSRTRRGPPSGGACTPP